MPPTPKPATTPKVTPPVAVPKPPPPPTPPPTPKVTKKPDPKPVDPYAAKPDNKQPDKKPKPDADAAFKAGFQAYMHGDNQTALTQLRAAVSTNPSYAAAWRVLGLLYTRMGENDMARAAFKRYLALAPNAGDADQIKERLEKL
jgi:tetratricopeptide (TPR) repeat protein